MHDPPLCLQCGAHETPNLTLVLDENDNRHWFNHSRSRLHFGDVDRWIAQWQRERETRSAAWPIGPDELAAVRLVYDSADGKAPAATSCAGLPLPSRNFL